MSQKLEFEVYVCKKNEVIIYVGEGRFGRHKHCTSGTSHVYALNKLHFEGVELDVEVVKVFKTKREAQEYEQHLIDKYLPVHNVKGTAWFKKQQCDTMTVNHTKDSYINWMKINYPYRNLPERVTGFIEELFSFYGHKNAVEGKFRFEVGEKYRRIGLEHLYQFVRGFRLARKDKIPTWVLLTYKYFRTQLNLDPVYMWNVTVSDETRDFWLNLNLDSLGRKV